MHNKKNLMRPSESIETEENLVKISKVLSKTGVVEAATKKQPDTKWKFYKLTNVTVFAALLEENLKGCEDALLPISLKKFHTGNCLIYEENTRKLYNDNLCLFRALDFHLLGNGRIEEEISESFPIFLEKNGRTNQMIFQIVCKSDIPILEDLVEVSIFLYDVVFDDEALIESLPGAVLENGPTLFDNCRTTVTFVLYSTVMLFIKLNVVHHVVSFLMNLETWRRLDILQGTS